MKIYRRTITRDILASCLETIRHLSGSWNHILSQVKWLEFASRDVSFLFSRVIKTTNKIQRIYQIYYTVSTELFILAWKPNAFFWKKKRETFFSSVLSFIVYFLYTAQKRSSGPINAWIAVLIQNKSSRMDVPGGKNTVFDTFYTMHIVEKAKTLHERPATSALCRVTALSLKR